MLTGGLFFLCILHLDETINFFFWGGRVELLFLFFSKSSLELTHEQRIMYNEAEVDHRVTKQRTVWPYIKHFFFFPKFFFFCWSFRKRKQKKMGEKKERSNKNTYLLFLFSLMILRQRKTKTYNLK